MRITKTESQMHMHPDDIKKFKTINISYEFSIEEPRAIKSRTGKEELLQVEYTFAIVYSNPSMGYLRYQGVVDCKKINESNNDISAEVRNEIAQTIVQNILPLALLSSKAMGLPPAVPLPIPPIEEPTHEKNLKDDEIMGYG